MLDNKFMTREQPIEYLAVRCLYLAASAACSEDIRYLNEISDNNYF